MPGVGIGALPTASPRSLIRAAVTSEVPGGFGSRLGTKRFLTHDHVHTTACEETVTGAVAWPHLGRPQDHAQLVHVVGEGIGEARGNGQLVGPGEPAAPALPEEGAADQRAPECDAVGLGDDEARPC